MLAVIYRAFVRPSHEDEFRQAWHQIATYFMAHCGALGSCLHQTDEGEWIAYSRWPDAATRAKHWSNGETLPEEIKAAVQTLKNCLDSDRPYEEIEMEVMEDLL